MKILLSYFLSLLLPSNFFVHQMNCLENEVHLKGIRESGIGVNIENVGFKSQTLQTKVLHRAIEDKLF